MCQCEKKKQKRRRLVTPPDAYKWVAADCQKGLKTRIHWAQVLAVSLAYELSPYRALQAYHEKEKKR